MVLGSVSEVVSNVRTMHHDTVSATPLWYWACQAKMLFLHGAVSRVSTSDQNKIHAAGQSARPCGDASMRVKADVFGNMDVSASNRTTDSTIGELYSSCNHGLEAVSGSPHGILWYWRIDVV
jgi:hypothetical protein